jgi:hypothetical protein
VALANHVVCGTADVIIGHHASRFTRFHGGRICDRPKQNSMPWLSLSIAKAEQNAEIPKLLWSFFAPAAPAGNPLRERAAKWGATEHVSSIPSPPCWQTD